MSSSPRIEDLAEQAMPQGAEPVSGLYGEWAKVLFPEPIPRESRATCSACPMIARDPAVSPRSLPVFSIVVKCCTYLPSLPNYLVGAILDDASGDPRGRESVLQRISRRVAVTPLSLGQTGTFRLAYEAAPEESFGRAESLRCPHYLDEGTCGIWKHRNAVCTTWFCKRVRGDVSEQFWTAFRTLLEGVEAELAVWAAGKAGVSPAVIADLLQTRHSPVRDAVIEELTGNRKGVIAEELWGSWRGREADFYVETSRLVAQLSWAEVLKLCGARTRTLALNVMHHYAALIMPTLPAAVELEPVEPTALANGLLSFRTFSRLDPIVLTREQWAALQSLAGQSLSEAKSAVGTEGQPFSEAMLQVALDWRLVRGVPERSEPPVG